MQLVFCRSLLEKYLGIVFQYDILVILKSNYKILSCRYFALFNSFLKTGQVGKQSLIEFAI